jgi:hypothetical protein
MHLSDESSVAGRKLPPSVVAYAVPVDVILRDCLNVHTLAQGQNVMALENNYCAFSFIVLN